MRDCSYISVFNHGNFKNGIKQDAQLSSACSILCDLGKISIATISMQINERYYNIYS